MATGVTRVLLLAPNLVGYVRLLLVLSALGVFASNPELVLWLFIINFSLDFFDGYLARKLNQCSAFGAFLDVMIDNVSRGTLWCWGATEPWSFMVPFLEMGTFVCTHKQGGAAWKSGCFANAPGYVQAVMKNGFRNPLGAFGIVGLMGSPLWAWANRFLPGTWYCHPALGLLMIAGRLIIFPVEVWLISSHVKSMLVEDANKCQ